jgi:hypothetical protein
MLALMTFLPGNLCRKLSCPDSLGLTVQMFEFDTGAGPCEVPIGLGAPGIAIVLASKCIVPEGSPEAVIADVPLVDRW